MAYPAYDTYNNQVAFPPALSRRQSMSAPYAGDFAAYDQPHAGGMYGEVRFCPLSPLRPGPSVLTPAPPPSDLPASRLPNLPPHADG